MPEASTGDVCPLETREAVTEPMEKTATMEEAAADRANEEASHPTEEVPVDRISCSASPEDSQAGCESCLGDTKEEEEELQEIDYKMRRYLGAAAVLDIPGATPPTKAFRANAAKYRRDCEVPGFARNRKIRQEPQNTCDVGCTLQ